jgi:hypothetical protein
LNVQEVEAVFRFARLVTSSLPVAALIAVALPASVGAQSMLVQTTPTYTVILQVAPAAQMVAPSMSMSSSMMDPMAEVIVGTVGMPMTGTDTSMSGSMGSHDSSSMDSSSMSSSSDMADQGMAVNHHLEVHITNNATGALVNDVSPVIRIRDKSTGVSRDLTDIMAMYSAQMGPSDFHYGQNVWLPDGQYDITVMLGSQSALFQDVMISGGTPPMMAMGG